MSAGEPPPTPATCRAPGSTVSQDCWGHGQWFQVWGHGDGWKLRLGCEVSTRDLAGAMQASKQNILATEMGLMNRFVSEFRVCNYLNPNRRFPGGK